MNTRPEQAAAEARAHRRRNYRSTVNVSVDIDIDEVLSEVPVEQLEAELHQRGVVNGASLLAVFEEFQRRGDAPQCLRDYIYEHLGRVL